MEGSIKKKWMRCVCSKFDEDKDPLKIINALQAIYWSIEVWEKNITSTTIGNCWVKTKVLSAKYEPRNVDGKNDLG